MNRKPRTRGQMAWNKQIDPYVPPAGPTEYELLLAELGIHEDDHERIRRSMIVREFARRKCTQVYVPEWLLDAMGIRVSEEEVYFHPRYRATV